MMFCDRMCLAMKTRGMTQGALETATGIGKGGLSHYMRGVYIPKQDNALKIAKALKVNPEWLIYGKGEMELTAEELHYQKMAEECSAKGDLLYYLDVLNADSVKELIRYAEYLKGKQDESLSK